MIIATMNLTKLTFLILIFSLCLSNNAIGQDALQTIADEALAEGHAPGLVVARLDLNDEDETSFQLASAGLRKSTSDEEFEPNDRIHLGSCTKAFTSVLVARLIQAEKLTWDSTIGEVLPDLADKISPEYTAVTLEQLLTHTSGMPANAKNWWLNSRERDVNEVRVQIAIDSLGEQPENQPGEKFVYSNLGYMVAGLMAAKAGEKTWERLIQSEVLKPLGIKSAGFGNPGRTNRVIEPWGHTLKGDRFEPTQHDNSAALGPAGTLHMNMEDWAKFVSVFMGNAPEDFLSEELIGEILQPSSLYGYGKGWGIAINRWGDETAYNHSGSNTYWYCTVCMGPESKRAYFVCLNCASEQAKSQAEAMMEKIIGLDQ